MRKTPDGNGNNHKRGKRGKLFKRTATVTATAGTAKFNNTRGSKGDSGSSVDAPGKPVIGTKRTEDTDNRKPGRPGRRPIAGAGSGAGAGAGTRARGNSGNSGSGNRATGTGTAGRSKAEPIAEDLRLDDLEEPEVETPEAVEVEQAPKVVKRGRKPATSKAGLKKDIEEKAEHLLGKMWGGLFGATGTLYGAHWGLQPAESSKLAADTMDVFRFLPEETFNRIIEFFTKVVPAGALVVSVMSLTIPRIAMTKMLINAQAQTPNT